MDIMVCHIESSQWYFLKVNAPDLPEVLAILKLCPRCFYISSFVVIALVAMWLVGWRWLYHAKRESLTGGIKRRVVIVGVHVRGGRYPIWFNSVWILPNNDSFNNRFNIALPKIQSKILFNSKQTLAIQFKR